MAEAQDPFVKSLIKFNPSPEQVKDISGSIGSISVQHPLSIQMVWKSHIMLKHQVPKPKRRKGINLMLPFVNFNKTELC